ncbi:MAG: glycosyltransferase [Saprospiraceae bacterium]
MTKIVRPERNDDAPYDLVVFCHLRWGFVYQRPQHIISRLSRTRKTLLIEEPWHRPESKEHKLIRVSGNLDVLQPNVHRIEDILDLLPTYFPNRQVAVGWMYSPSFLPLLDYFDFGTLVYDCMDELSLFKGAPEAIIAQETALLAAADVIYTGGKSLYEAKRDRHQNVHCFPSSVDERHFARALEPLDTPADMEQISAPVVGYFGVIDERIDYGLLDETARLLPGVNFAMVGPLAKVGEEDLPRRENIHYLGMKAYEELPAYLRCFDIAMMPFALNDSTKFISPTKTLEYMAAGRPIISTPIRDVVRDYDEVVSIVSDAPRFAAAVERMLVKGEIAQQILGRYRPILERTSWDNTVTRMDTLLTPTTVQ